MSLSDFFDNITDPYRVCMLIQDLLDCTTELAQDVIELCENEGVDVLKAAPAAVEELSGILLPLSNPTPVNILRSGRALKQALGDDEKVKEETPLLLLPPPKNR